MSCRPTPPARAAAAVRRPRWAKQTKNDSPGRASRAVNQSNLCGVVLARRRWHSAQAGERRGCAGDAAEHRDSENDAFHHGALLLKQKRLQPNMACGRRHARGVGCAVRLISSEAC